MAAPWKTTAERDEHLRSLIEAQASVFLNANQSTFRDECKTRIRKDLEYRGVSALVIWWILSFVAGKLIDHFFFSAEADQYR